MDSETGDFLTWATDRSRTVEELFGIELLAEQCASHWNHKHGVTVPFNWEAIRLTRKNRQLDPRYKPRLTRARLEQTAEVLDKITSFSTNAGEDRHLRDLERARGAIPPGWEYTLPTEAQWEYACRAGSETAYSFGNDPADLHKHGNYNDESANYSDSDMAHNDGIARTGTVGSYPANQWGFHDMHGNVIEWCRDALDPNEADYGAADATDPLAKIGSLRVLRGGGFSDTARNCRSAVRFASPPSSRINYLGFRPALSPP